MGKKTKQASDSSGQYSILKDRSVIPKITSEKQVLPKNFIFGQTRGEKKNRQVILNTKNSEYCSLEDTLTSVIKR